MSHKTLCSEVSEIPHQESSPSRKKKTTEVETVLPRPQPEDRVEVVLPALSQRQRDSADSAGKWSFTYCCVAAIDISFLVKDRNQLVVKQPAYARKRSLMPEFARVMRASEGMCSPAVANHVVLIRDRVTSHFG